VTKKKRNRPPTVIQMFELSQLILNREAEHSLQQQQMFWNTSETLHSLEIRFLEIETEQKRIRAEEERTNKALVEINKRIIDLERIQ
jgi:hypothetical protein